MYFNENLKLKFLKFYLYFWKLVKLKKLLLWGYFRCLKRYKWTYKSASILILKMYCI